MATENDLEAKSTKPFINDRKYAWSLLMTNPTFRFCLD